MSELRNDNRKSSSNLKKATKPIEEIKSTTTTTVKPNYLDSIKKKEPENKVVIEETKKTKLFRYFK